MGDAIITQGVALGYFLLPTSGRVLFISRIRSLILDFYTSQEWIEFENCFFSLRAFSMI